MSTPNTAPTSATPVPAAAPVEAKVEGKVDAKVTPPPAAVPSPDAYQPGQKFRLGIDGTIAPWTRLGGPEGNIFDHGFAPPNEGFDHSMKRLGAVFGWKIFDPSPFFQLWLQGSAAYRNYSGSKDTPGELHGFDIGVGPCLASIGLYSKKNDRVITGPELCGAFSFLYMNGDSTAGNNFSVDHTSGPGYGLSAKLSPIGFNVLGGNIAPYVGIDTANIPNARGDANAPFWAAPTFGLTFTGAVGPKPAKIESVDCTDLEVRVRQHADDVETLRNSVTNSMAEFKATSDALKAAGYTPEKIRDALRKGFVEVKKAQDKPAIEAAIKAKTPDIKEADLKKQVDEAFKAKEEAYTSEAKVRYGDNFDYYNLALPPMDPALLDEARKIASDPTCSKDKNKKMLEILDRLNNERIALEKSDTQIDERKKMLHFAMGNPGVNKVIKNLGGLAFAQFPPVNFNSGRPDYPGKGTKDMAKLEAFLAANKGRAPLDPKDPGLQAAYKGIFAGNELLAIHRFTQQINGIEPLRGVKVKGVTEDELKQLVRSVPLIIQGHTSYTDGTPEGNQVLSENRARAVAIAMILFGTDENRLKTEGKGITEPIVPETEDWTPGGKKVKNLNWSQEKNRRIMLLVDVEKLEQSGNQPTASAKPGEAPKADGPKTPALVPTGSAPKAPPPPPKGSGVE